jgi:hypothetical protein
LARRALVSAGGLKTVEQTILNPTNNAERVSGYGAVVHNVFPQLTFFDLVAYWISSHLVLLVPGPSLRWNSTTTSQSTD